MHRDRRSTARRGIRLVLVVLVAAVAVAACGREPRPDVATWRARWEEARALVPPAEALQPPDDQVCEDVLVDLRATRPDLSPAPDDVLEESMVAWITFAESTFFECFDDDIGADSVEVAYGRLDQLADEVDAALGAAG